MEMVAQEAKDWRASQRDAAKTGGGPPQVPWPEHKPDEYPATFPGTTRGGLGNPYADLLPPPPSSTLAAFKLSLAPCQSQVNKFNIFFDLLIPKCLK